MKYKHTLIIVFLVLFIDQVLKLYIKTHFYLGESIPMLGNWGQLYFIENEGMAFGMTLTDAAIGKIILTLFRLIAVVYGFFLVKRLTVQGYSKGLLICASLILAGAAGNLIDSMFYGVFFTESGYDPFNVAKLVPWGKGYAPFLYGHVVDMFYFPLIDTTWPTWVPYFGGKSFQFFEPVFNFADAAISTGVLVLVFFQKKLIKKKSVQDLTEPAPSEYEHHN